MSALEHDDGDGWLRAVMRRIMSEYFARSRAELRGARVVGLAEWRRVARGSGGESNSPPESGAQNDSAPERHGLYHGLEREHGDRWPSVCIHGRVIPDEGEGEWCPQCRELGRSAHHGGD